MGTFDLVLDVKFRAFGMDLYHFHRQFAVGLPFPLPMTVDLIKYSDHGVTLEAGLNLPAEPVAAPLVHEAPAPAAAANPLQAQIDAAVEAALAKQPAAA